MSTDIYIHAYRFPIYGFHVHHGSVIIYSEQDMERFVDNQITGKDTYRYKGEYFAASYEELKNEEYRYSDEAVNKTFNYRWVFTDSNDNRFPMREYIENQRYNRNMNAYLDYYKHLKPGMSVHGTGIRRRKRFRDIRFHRGKLIENEVRKEYEEEYGKKWFTQCFKNSDYEKTRKKQIRKDRDGQFKSWKLYRKHQWKG